jgi:hypothetical protein
MRQAIPIVVLRGDPGEDLTLMLHTAAPKYKDNPYSEPTALTTGMRTGDIAYLQVSLFPGAISMILQTNWMLSSVAVSTMSNA